MRTLVQRIHSHPQYARVVEWSKLVTITGSAQLIIQIIGFLCGVLVIRLLPTTEYALYTLANTMLGTMVLLADSGITSGVMSQGGPVWQDKEKLGRVVATGLNLRNKFGVVSLLIAVPILVYLLHHHGASLLFSVAIVVALIPSYFNALSGELLEIAPKLKQDIVVLQKLQVAGNIGRLVSLCVFIFIFPWAYIAVLANGLPQIWTNLRLRKLAATYVDSDAKPDPAIRKEILKVVKRLLPGVVYYCLSGQITIWIISVFGSTTSVAQLGALGRLAMTLNVISIVFAMLVVPRFARTESVSKVLFNRYIQVQGALLGVCLLATAFVWIFATQVLWILGPKYAGLEYEVVLIIIGACLNILAGSSFSLLVCRGWVLNPLISIPINVVTMIVGASLLNVSTLDGVLYFNILISFVQVIMNAVFLVIKILELKQEKVELIYS